MRWFALVLALSSSTALAQESQSPARTDDPAIVVTGQSKAETRAYVDRVARPEPSRKLARWNGFLCVQYDGMEQRYARFIQARITSVAERLGVKTIDARCSANVIVILSDRADALVQNMVLRRPPPIGNITSDNPVPARVRRALEVPHTVRWFTATETVDRDGRPSNLGLSQRWKPSRLIDPTREDSISKIVLIDKTRLPDVTFDQLADYIAFVTLASPDVTADFSATNSIMRLFAGTGDKSARMTRQDLAFLDALYSVSEDQSAIVQKIGINAHLGRVASEEQD